MGLNRKMSKATSSTSYEEMDAFRSKQAKEALLFGCLPMPSNPLSPKDKGRAMHQSWKVSPAQERRKSAIPK